ncbi:MAG: FtsX-like permease family protein [Duncaniella sp.]|nr:FtsX-like permease family protein [Duncaniella sp.]
MSLPYFLAKRISLSSPSGESRSGIVIAVTGIALSMIVMLVSIAVMMGFKHEVRQKIIGFDAQLTVSPLESKDRQAIPLIEIDSVKTAVGALPDYASATLTIRQPAIIKTPLNFAGAVIKGMDKDFDWKFIRENLVDGVVPDYKSDSTLYHIVISHAIASSLELELGDKVDAYFLGNNASYRTRRLKIAGIYDTHFSEYDKHFIFSNLEMLQQLGNLSEKQGTVLEISGLNDDEEIERTRGILVEKLYEELYSGRTERLYSVGSIHESAAMYFNWLALLDTNVVVILVLMALLGMLTLVSSLFILVLRRVTMIGILKALGATDRQIRTSFVILTFRILLGGLLAGNAIGLALIALQEHLKVLPLNPEAYYLDHVPVMINIPSVLILNAAVILLAFLTLLLPSAIITTIPPSRAINYD